MFKWGLEGDSIMMEETISTKRSTVLRKNNSNELIITIDSSLLQNIFLINGTSFKTREISKQNLIIKPESCYMIINQGKNSIEVQYNRDVSEHEIIYNPYKFENSDKINYHAEYFIERYEIPEDYIDILPKWYSFKFTYPHYNLIFVKPEFGLSIQFHKQRTELWEVLDGKPIILSGYEIYYYVEKNRRFTNHKNAYHSIINPNKREGEFIIIKERWEGEFDENDIERIFNPNQYY